MVCRSLPIGHYSGLQLRNVSYLFKPLSYPSLLPSEGSKESWDCLMTMPAQWRQFSSLVHSMVECDVQLLPLFDVGNALDALINLYLDAVCEQIHAFVLAIDSRLFHRNNSDPPPRKAVPSAPKPGGGSSGGGILVRTRRRVSPELPPTPPGNTEFDDISSPVCDLLGQEALLLIVDTLSSWCQLESHLLQVGTIIALLTVILYAFHMIFMYGIMSPRCQFIIQVFHGD